MLPLGAATASCIHVVIIRVRDAHQGGGHKAWHEKSIKYGSVGERFRSRKRYTPCARSLSSGRASPETPQA